MTADLQASQAVFCFRGGGRRVFASSCMWFCADWEGKAKTRRTGCQGGKSKDAKETSYRGREGGSCGTTSLGRADTRVRKGWQAKETAPESPSQE